MRTDCAGYCHQGDCKAVLKMPSPQSVDQKLRYVDLFLKYSKMTTHPLESTLQMLICHTTMPKLAYCT